MNIQIIKPTHKTPVSKSTKPKLEFIADLTNNVSKDVIVNTNQSVIEAIIAVGTKQPQAKRRMHYDVIHSLLMNLQKQGFKATSHKPSCVVFANSTNQFIIKMKHVNIKAPEAPQQTQELYMDDRLRRIATEINPHLNSTLYINGNTTPELYTLASYVNTTHVHVWQTDGYVDIFNIPNMDANGPIAVYVFGRGTVTLDGLGTIGHNEGKLIESFDRVNTLQDVSALTHRKFCILVFHNQIVSVPAPVSSPDPVQDMVEWKVYKQGDKTLEVFMPAKASYYSGGLIVASTGQSYNTIKEMAEDHFQGLWINAIIDEDSRTVEVITSEAVRRIEVSSGNEFNINDFRSQVTDGFI